MADRKHVDFESIYHGLQPETGRFRLAETGIGWKGTKDKKEVVAATDLKKLGWQKSTRGYQLRVVLKDDTIMKFDGFKSDEFEDLSDAIKSFYKLPLQAREVSVKGWNWGEADFQGSNLIFNVSNKPMFELPLAQAIGTNKSGKNEVTVNFVDPGQPAPEGVNPKEVDELVDVTFYVPGTVSKESENKDEKDEEDEDEEEEVNADMVFYETVKSKLEFSHMTTENIIQFQEILCLTPRGRYNIDMYQDFLRLRGKSYDYKILYSNIVKLFLLLKPDDLHVLFVMGLDPPLRQGQTKYPFLVFQFVREDEIDVELNLDDQTIADRYDGKLQKKYEAPTYEVVSTIFRALTGRKVTVPGSFRSHHGAHALKCSLKANEGYLYPLEKSFVFIPKPTTFVPLNEISAVTFSRVSASSSAGSKTFDMKFHMKNGNDIQFSSLNREEFSNIEDFLKQKTIKVKSERNEDSMISYAELDNELEVEEEEEEEEEEDFSSRKRRRTGDAMDEDDESPDEDFAPDDSGSDVAEEYDTDAEGSSEDQDD